MLTFPRTSDAEYFSVLEELYPSSSVVIGELPRDTEIASQGRISDEYTIARPGPVIAPPTLF
jgi:hypothetical protein